MKVRELIEMLEGFDGDAEVLLASQPGWPLANYVEGVVENAALDHDEEEDRFGDVVWIVEGGQHRHPYAPRGVWDEV